MEQDTLEIIQKVGHWRVNFRPTRDQGDNLSLLECRKIVENNSISLRGWDYPHFSRQNNEHGSVVNAGDHVGGWCKWGNFIEIWRMYRSTQFLHYLALREELDEHPDKPEGRVISVTGTVYTITEIIEFASRLCLAGLYKDGCQINISLGHARGRQLWISDPMRMGFYDVKATQAENILVTRTLATVDFAEKAQAHALEIILEFFDHFGWNPAPAQIEADQKRLYERRYS